MSLQHAAILLDHLSIGYGNTVVKDHISLKADKGSLVALIGRNGTGKSTLLRTIAGLERKLGGDVYFYETRQDKYSISELSKLIAFVNTDYPNVPAMKVREMVAYGRMPYTNWFGMITKADQEIIDRAIELVGIGHLLHKQINEISDGERQKTMIARAIAQDSDIVILDEPTSFLDIANRYEILHLLKNIAHDEQKTVIFSSHDLNITLREADLIWMMDKGRIVKQGAPEDMVLNGDVSHLFEDDLVQFDITRGDFFIPVEYARKVNVKAEGVERLWTVRALERIGFEVVEAEVALKVSVLKENGAYVWRLNDSRNENKRFLSLYELIHFIKT